MDIALTNRHIALAAGLLAVVVALAFGVGYKVGVRSVAVPDAAQEVLASATPRPTPIATPVAPSKLPKTYSEVAVLYRGRRLAVSDECGIEPTEMTQSNGIGVMLDNRSREPRTVTIGTASYTLAGYGWRIITLWSKAPPVILPVGCEGNDVGAILLQK